MLVLAVGFASYQYVMNGSPETQTPAVKEQESSSIPLQDTNSEVQNTNPEVKTQGVKAVGTSGGGTLTVCSDWCGDGICQSTYQYCQNNDLNCICLESHADCPADCPDIPK